jgi:hypothetical protein
MKLWAINPLVFDEQEENIPGTNLGGHLGRTIGTYNTIWSMGFWQPKGGVAHMGSSF